MGLQSKSTGPASPEEFAKLLLDRLRAAGDRRQVRFDPAEFRLYFTQDGKDAGVTFLGNFYQEYLRLSGPDQPTWWTGVIRGVLSYQKTIPDEFEDAKPDLRPVVRARAYVDAMKLDQEIKGEAMPDVPYMPIGDHLVAVVVYDLPETMAHVNQKQMDQWGVTFYEAMEIARQNLAEIDCKMISIGDKLFSPVGGDSYDSSRLLLVDHMQNLDVAGDYVALAVNRDALLITGSDDTEGLKIMADLATKKLEDPRPLCSIPVRLNGDQWETWLPSPGHPEFFRFKKLEAAYLGGAYANQKKQLDTLHQKQGIDEFVGSYGTAEKADEIFTYAVWSKGVQTHLPKTDTLFLFAETPALRLCVPWERAAEVVGHLMQEEELYPPRWFVKEFPTDKQLEAMGGESL